MGGGVISGGGGGGGVDEDGDTGMGSRSARTATAVSASAPAVMKTASGAVIFRFREKRCKPPRVNPRLKATLAKIEGVRVPPESVVTDLISMSFRGI